MGDHIVYRSDSLSAAASEMSRLQNALDDIIGDLARVDTSGEWWSKVRVQNFGGTVSAREALGRAKSMAGKAQTRVSDVTGGVRRAQALFDEAERQVSAHAANLHGGSDPDTAAHDRTAGDGSAAADSSGRTWFGYEFDEDHPGVTAWIGRTSAEVGGELAYAGVNGYIGKAKAEAKAEANLMKREKTKKYQDGKWVEEEKLRIIAAEAVAGASVAALSGDAYAGVGSDMLGLEGKVEAAVGKAEAEANAQFSVGEDGINANVGGKAMVSAVQGEASGTFNILGFEITGKIGGYAGAAGVEGQAGIVDNKFVLEGGLAALVGVSAGVEIGFNDEGWENFVDFITFWN